MIIEKVRLEVQAGETLAIIGRNGVGKTTLLSTMMGHTTLHSGRIRLLGRDISRMPAYRRVAAGLGYVPQEREIFPSLTLRENLEVAARPGPWTMDAVFALFPRLAERQRNWGRQLSGGEQQMLAIGRALIGNPAVILMDEPSEGLAPVIVEELARAVRQLVDAQGLTLVLVEQNTRLALDISPRMVVMNRGRITYDGLSEPLKAEPGKARPIDRRRASFDRLTARAAFERFAHERSSPQIRSIAAAASAVSCLRDAPTRDRTAMVCRVAVAICAKRAGSALAAISPRSRASPMTPARKASVPRMLSSKNSRIAGSTVACAGAVEIE